MTSLSCSDCGAALKPNPRRKGTRCKPCASRATTTSPAMREACSRAMRRRWADPNEAEVLRNAIRQGCSTPKEIERRRKDGRIPPACRIKASEPETRRRAAFTYVQRRLDWLPLEYRDEYRRLTRGRKVRAAEARKLIEKQIRDDLKKYRSTGRLPLAERREARRK